MKRFQVTLLAIFFIGPAVKKAIAAKNNPAAVYLKRCLEIMTSAPENPKGTWVMIKK